MTIEYIRYKIGNDRREAFIDALRRATHHLSFRRIRYELTRRSDQQESYTFRTEWQSTEQRRRFREDLAGKAFMRALSSFTREIEEQGQWDLTDVVHVPQAPSIELANGASRWLDRPPWNGLYAWIFEHLGERILVDRMAERVNMSPRNFARVFQRKFGIPPGEFLDRVRVAAAKSDLEDGLLSVEQIAAARGFQSASTMRRTFLRVLGFLPSLYRAAMDCGPNGKGRTTGWESTLDPAA